MFSDALLQIKPPEERLDSDTIEDLNIGRDAGLPVNEEGEAGSTQRVRNDAPLSGKYPAGVQFPETHRPGYDEYGEELSKGARVWKTYVQEAARWDADLVDGWNSFVIESSKNLQPDSAGSSDQTLITISQTLILIANSQPGSSLNLTLPERPDFVASRSAVYVNTLWFLSLSLSVSVSLVAMLAKDWTRGYIAELTGQPYQQARKRQQRWDGLKEWMMPEVIAFLPSVLHLALRLTLYLWNIHLGAALPVLIVTAVSIAIYGVSTALPLVQEHCPYSTPLSKLVLMLPRPAFLRQPIRYTWRASLVNSLAWIEPEDLMDKTTSRALAWLIVNYEDSRSADIALQAIAGASFKLPSEPLHDCGASSLLEQKLRNCFGTSLTTQELYLKDVTSLEALSLYGRALLVPAIDIPGPLIDNKIISITTSPNKLAFALSAIAHGSTNSTQPKAYIALTTQLLELHLKDQVTLLAPALLELLRAATLWPGFSDSRENRNECTRLMVTLARFLPSLGLHDGNSHMYYSLVGTALTAFACSRRDYSYWPFVHDVGWRGEDGLVYRIPQHYNRSPPSDNATTSSLLTFGLLEFLKYHAADLDADDVKTIAYALGSYNCRPASISIFGLSERSFGSNYEYITEIVAPFLTVDSQGAYAWSEDVRVAWLTIFNQDYLKKSPYAMDICALALDNFRSARSSSLRERCCQLVAGLPMFWVGASPVGSKGRNIFSLYLGMLEYEDERVVPYIMVGLVRIIDAEIAKPSRSFGSQEVILQSLRSCKQPPNVTQQSSQGSRTVMMNVLIACAEVWICRLEDMAGRIPRHIYKSFIFDHLPLAIRRIPQGIDHPLHQRCLDLKDEVQRSSNMCEAADWS
ncbi:hypothetical protein FRC09_017475 [Ceratobasidium sp. 395]|nr:hypothetical protein FRC09_017475 [Ceratobasidium sp. 395]